jgi:hypothetical protein
MKVQIFQGNTMSQLTNQINKWMEENRVGTLRFVAQSGSRSDSPSITISIWY